MTTVIAANMTVRPAVSIAFSTAVVAVAAPPGPPRGSA